MQRELAFWKQATHALLLAAAEQDVEALVLGVEQHALAIEALEAAPRPLDPETALEIAACQLQLERAVEGLREAVSTELREVRGARDKLRRAKGGRSELKSVRV